MINNRWHILSVLLLLLPAGCVKRVPETVPAGGTDPVLLAFAAPVVTPQVKAQVPDKEMPVDYDTGEHLSVYAAYHTVPYTSASTPTTLLMENVDCGYNNALTAWDPACGADSKAYYWPPQGYLSFQAYSPTGLADDCTLTHSFSGGFSFTGYRTPDSGSQYDILVSRRSFNRTRRDYSATVPYDENAGDQGACKGVDLLFSHALCSITFRARTQADYSPMITLIRKIEIVGACGQGDFVQGLSDNAAADEYRTGYPRWESITDASRTFTAFDGALTLSTTPRPITAGTGAHATLLIPQPMYRAPGEISVRITYGQKANAEAPEVTRQIIVSLYNGGDYFKYDDDAGVERPLTTWEMGKRYTYTVSIGSNRIFFDPEVSAWNDAAVTPDIEL